MAREWFELTPSQILRKVYTKEFLYDLLERTFKDLPVKRGGVIGDRDWTVNSNYPFMIKVDWKNYAYITKKAPYWSVHYAIEIDVLLFDVNVLINKEIGRAHV